MDAGDAAGFQPVSVYADVRVWDMVDWAQLYLFELIFMRMSGFLLFNPLLGRSNLPAMVKTGMALVLSILVFGTAGTGVPQPDTLVELAFRLLLELGIGLVLGFVMRVVFSVVQIGGEVIDTQMGMTMAQIYDASSQANLSVTASLLNILLILDFFAENGHYTLTYGLLRMANSCYYALRHRVTSVRQAIMTMGLSELRQWVYLLSASNAENQMEEGAEEFLRMSFMRANFCSKLMNYAKDMPISKPDAYLMGMFSTLNYLIDAPLAEILKPIPLCAEAKEALLQHTGRAGMLYDLALSYEHADWEKIDRLTGELGIPTNLLTSLYFTCMEEVNRVWIEMNRPVQGQITDDTKIDT